jgi:hypothetical protein
MLTVIPSNSAQGGYRIANSLRFRSSASAYLNRTPASASDQKKWTFSAWVKRGQLGATQIIAEAGTSGTTFTYIAYFNASDQLVILDSTVSGVSSARTSTAVFRDPSAWYHIVVNLDAANSVCNGYVNGVAQTFTGTQPSNQNWAVNSAIEHRIGRAWGANTNYFDGYLADINFIDGQALTPSSFGQISTITGVWQPKAYSGTYGTNGFKLNFSNGTSTTTLGYDSSGNSNNWTTNNISLTAGSTYDWMIDSPTPFAGSSYGVGNYAVLNPLKAQNSLSNANLTYAGASGTNTFSTIAVSSGKWYWETQSDQTIVGIQLSNADISNLTTNYGYWPSGQKYTGGTGSAYGASFTSSDIIGVALDLDAGTLTFYKNNVSQGVAFSSLSGSYCPWLRTGTGSLGGQFNFGQRPFSYTPPTGYKSLCTQNLPAPLIKAGNKHFDATTYTGTGSTQSIVNAGGFQPDLVWLKSRSLIAGHELVDSVRGAVKTLYSNLTNAEDTTSQTVTAFNSNGFSIGNDSGANSNGATQIAWQWKANGTAVTNNAGSITSQVSANTTAGFSVVTYTGNGSAGATVGHGLGVAPSMIIVKNRSVVENWPVYHTSLTANGRILLNTTGAYAASSAQWNNTTPTSSVFTVNTDTGVNGSGNSLVAYCFAAIPGFSAFGRFSGNASTDGVFVYTGFLPRLVMVKCSSGVGNWFMLDTSRNTYNVVNNQLYPNLSNAETSATTLDILSNGFKMRTSSDPNASATYVYAAWASNPFQNSLAN